ncbi:hypothetical protein [Psychroserpens mesophilus]|uniref:hypothetical protein n=1 Tax=Psychroserpens mesophilus TaxID=325473 RepID=UPI003D6565AF
MNIKRYSVFLIILILFSCGNEKKVLLPEIEQSKITEVLDVSPAYLFYDETQPDSIELNRKNLIGTTNWLFNVDKRLTLEQAIPKIKFLQNKKRNAQMHTNENAKNYFTCNNTSIQNLGFIEFTNVFYQNKSLRDFFEYNKRPEKMSVALNAFSSTDFSLESYHQDISNTDVYSTIEDAISKIEAYFKSEQDFKLYLLYSSTLSFQDYITIKSKIESLKEIGVPVEHNEFIY